MLWAQGVPGITSVTKDTNTVGKYEKLELTVVLTASYTNAYNPDDVDLSAEFTSPSGKVWKINGFYNGSQWKIRFAGNETGDWHYVVIVKDFSGMARSVAGTFTCTASDYHGWVRVASNRRYLCYDDGTSFYGVGVCHAWGVTPNSLDRMEALGFNMFVYWNGTYDRNGGNNLIESMASGLGHYDQSKCTRIDNLIDWSEARGLTMILVILPHDYACENNGNMGRWQSQWRLNPYNTIVSADNYYSDAASWDYQQKQYRYIIARWGYSRALSVWQTVDEISGTSGWKADQTAANTWAAKMAAYFQIHDPFKHPTTASLGNFWDEGNQANDLPNTEIYRDYSTSNTIATVQRLWSGYEKPCIMGETGRDSKTAHDRIWGAWATGISATPLLWSFNGWDTNLSAIYPPFEKFIANINFAGLTSPTQAKVVVAGAEAWGITSDQMAFGWITGDISGKSFTMTDLKDGHYRMEWFDCRAGNTILTNYVSVNNDSLMTTIPITSQSDLAYKLIPQYQ